MMLLAKAALYSIVKFKIQISELKQSRCIELASLK